MAFHSHNLFIRTNKLSKAFIGAFVDRNRFHLVLGWVNLIRTKLSLLQCCLCKKKVVDKIADKISDTKRENLGIILEELFPVHPDKMNSVRIKRGHNNSHQPFSTYRFHKRMNFNCHVTMYFPADQRGDFK